MRQAQNGNSAASESTAQSNQNGGRSVPTIFATELLAKLIADRDAAAVLKAVIAHRRH